MANEQTQKPEKGHEEHKAAEKPVAGAPITDKADNSRQDVVKQADAIRSFKLTKEGQNSFTLVDDSKEIKDSRPLRRDESQASEAVATLEKPSKAQDAGHSKPGDSAGSKEQPHNKDGMYRPTSETHKVYGPDGASEVTTTTNADGTSSQTTVRPNGDKETVQKDAKGRETEHSKSHQTPLGEVVDEKKTTSYDQLGLPTTTTTKYDLSGRETSTEKEDPTGHKHSEKYRYDQLGGKHISETTDSGKEVTANGVVEKTATKSETGATTETTTKPNGDKEVVKKDPEGRETEHTKSHKGPFGDDVPDEKKTTTYGRGGTSESTTTKYDAMGRENETTKESSWGNTHTEKYAYDNNGGKVVTEEIDKDKMSGTTTDTKYDDNHRPTTKDTSYSDGRPADHEQWFYGDDGTVFHVKNGKPSSRSMRASAGMRATIATRLTPCRSRSAGESPVHRCSAS